MACAKRAAGAFTQGEDVGASLPRVNKASEAFAIGGRLGHALARSLPAMKDFP